ncbi:MAG: TetR/AcrR family transcriptional regulator [Burkholderiaceae bacterium]
MDSKPSRREQSHQRIVDAAARAVRRVGYDGVGVAAIMKEAGLTHGGFYAHFDSREALLAEAVRAAGQAGAERLRARLEQGRAHGLSPLRVLLEGYLSEDHLRGTEQGCVVAALCSEMPRQAGPVQDASRERVQALVERVRDCLPERSRAEAPWVAASMVGSLQLARALGAEPGAALLRQTREQLLQRFDASGLAKQGG